MDNRLYKLKEFSHNQLVDKASGEVIDLNDPNEDTPDDIIRDIVSGDVEVRPVYVSSFPVTEALGWALNLADPESKGVIYDHDRKNMVELVFSISKVMHMEAKEFVDDFLKERGISVL